MSIISLEQSSDEKRNYEIDVTAMLQQRTAHFGFMLKLADESYYRSLTFGASDAIDAGVRPKLVIKYSAN